MAVPFLAPLLGIAEKVIDRVIPDPKAKAEALQKMAELQQQGELAFLDADVKAMVGQLEINKVEAMTGGIFKGGWRPFIGWVCGLAFGYKFLLQPFLVFIVQAIAHFTGNTLFPIDKLPDLAWSEMSVVMLGMLGLGTMRHYEKKDVRESANK